LNERPRHGLNERHSGQTRGSRLDGLQDGHDPAPELDASLILELEPMAAEPETGPVRLKVYEPDPVPETPDVLTEVELPEFDEALLAKNVRQPGVTRHHVGTHGRLAINAQPLEKVKVALNGTSTQQAHHHFPA